MADLTDLEAAETVKIVGANTSNVEQTPVNATTNGALHTNLRNNAGTEIATVSNPVRIDPTGTTAQPVTQSGVWQSEISSRAASQQMFSVQTALTNIGTTETAFVLVKNPNGSGKTLRITRVFLSTSGSGTIRLYHTPTITSNGSTLAINNRYIKTSPTATVMTAFTSPTISVNGTIMFLALTTTQLGTFQVFDDQDLILDPNFNILITVQNGANNTPTAVGIEWAEV